MKAPLKQNTHSMKKDNTNHFELFRTFFKIGAFTLGGGYAMIPIIESEVVEKRRWLSQSDFVNLIAVAQSCPGVFAINLSTFVGYKLGRTLGAVCASFATALPSFLVILAIAMCFRNFQDNPVVESIFKGIRPAVVALIAVPTWNMARSAKLRLVNCWIPVASTIAIWAMGVNPVYIILCAGAGGYLYNRFVEPTE